MEPDHSPPSWCWSLMRWSRLGDGGNSAAGGTPDGVGEPTGTVFEESLHDEDVGKCSTKGGGVRIMNTCDVSVLTEGIALGHVNPIKLPAPMNSWENRTPGTLWTVAWNDVRHQKETRHRQRPTVGELVLNAAKFLQWNQQILAVRLSLPQYRLLQRLCNQSAPS
jgi:hypothetical protein